MRIPVLHAPSVLVDVVIRALVAVILALSSPAARHSGSAGLVWAVGLLVWAYAQCNAEGSFACIGGYVVADPVG